MHNAYFIARILKVYLSLDFENNCRIITMLEPMREEKQTYVVSVILIKYGRESVPKEKTVTCLKKR